jgi:hypothetical protein
VGAGKPQEHRLNAMARLQDQQLIFDKNENLVSGFD